MSGGGGSVVGQRAGKGRAFAEPAPKPLQLLGSPKTSPTTLHHPAPPKPCTPRETPRPPGAARNALEHPPPRTPHPPTQPPTAHGGGPQRT